MESSIFKNRYIISEIYSFLPFKDKFAFSSSKKICREVFNKTSKSLALKEYTSDLSDYSLFSPISNDQISSQYFYFQADSKNLKPLENDWITFLINGKKIQNLFKKICSEETENKKFSEESSKLGEDLFGKLKEYLTLPNLRKVNKYVENDINTCHQTFLYDFLYDDQDVYLFYKKQNRNKNKSNLLKREITVTNKEIECRKPNLPFSEFFSLLGSLSEDIDNPENLFEEIRCYNLTFGNDKIVNMDYEGMVNFHQNFNKNFEIFYQSFLSGEISTSNKLIRILVVIYVAVIYFCLITFILINDEEEQKEFLLLDNIVKRHRAFVDVAININNQLENINAATNLIFEKVCAGNEEVFPKFSIYRLMLNTFYKLVINPIMSNKTIYRNPLAIYSDIYYKTTEKEIMSLFSHKESREFCCSPCTLYSENHLVKNPNELEGNYEKGNAKSSFTQEYDNSSISTYQSTKNSMIIEGASFKSSISTGCSNETDLTVSLFLEGFPTVLLDYTCNEYNVFYINSTGFIEEGYYKTIVDGIIKNNEIIIKKHWNGNNGLKLLNYFSNNEFISCESINVTKKRVLEEAYSTILSLEKKCFLEGFQNYLNKPIQEQDGEGDTEMISGDYSECKNIIFNYSFLVLYYNDMINLAQAKVPEENEDKAKYIVDVYLQHESTNQNLCYQTIEEATNLLNELKETQMEEDEIIGSETKRRNILLTKKIYKPESWNFNTNLSVDEFYNTIS